MAKEEGFPTPLRSASFEGQAALGGLPAVALAKAGEGLLLTGPRAIILNLLGIF